MTSKERVEKLRCLITCMKCEVSGKECDNNCPTQYDTGNMGEIIENLEEIAKALEQEPCEDAISRKAVLDKLNRLIEVEQLQGTDEMGYGRERVSAYECMIQDVESEYLYPNIQLNEDEGWIPVSERLPEENGFYLATCDGEICGEDEPISGMAEFENGKWVDDEDDYQCVLAWMPLPEPYKAESEE